MRVSIPFDAISGVGISGAGGWPHARAPACKDQHCSPERLFDLLGTPRKGRTDPFMQYVVEEQCVEDNADPSLLPKIAWWGLWFSWTGQTPDSLLLSRLVQGIKTLPSVCHETPEGDKAEVKDESPQANEIAGSSSTALEAAQKNDKRSLIKEAAGGIDQLLLEHVQNKKGLGVEDRKNDLRLIKGYQKALRAVHAAPHTVLGAVLGLGTGIGVQRLRQSSQPPLDEFITAQETQQAHPAGATLYEISSDDEDVEYEVVSNEAPSLRSRATTVEEVIDEEEPLKRSQAFSSQKGKEVAIAPAEEKTFKQAWEDLKVMAQGIKEISKPEDSRFQKTCLTILSGFDKFLGFVPLLPSAVTAIRYFCYEVRRDARDMEWENRNAVRKALIEISAAILAAPDAEEVDMSAVDTIKQNQQAIVNAMGENIAIAGGLAMQEHTKTINNSAKQALKVTEDNITNAVISHIDARLAAFLPERTRKTSTLSDTTTLAGSRSISPELEAKDKRIAELEKQLEETKAEKEGLQKQNEKLLDALINRA